MQSGNGNAIGREEEDDGGGSDLQLLQRIGCFLQPPSLLFRCPQAIHRSPTYSSRYSSLSFSNSRVCLLSKFNSNSSIIVTDSASSIFMQCLNRRVSTATADLDMLDSMSFGTVSFEELLGHCSELYKKNHSDLLQLQERLQSFGYTPGTSKTKSPNITSFCFIILCSC